MTPDVINGLFEFGGSIMLWMNVRKLYRDKMSRGVSFWATSFFMAWGYWNMIYYPSLDQWLSFAGGCSITAANTVWLYLMWLYRRN